MTMHRGLDDSDPDGSTPLDSTKKGWAIEKKEQREKEQRTKERASPGVLITLMKQMMATVRLS